jgi:hypothetical protein
MLGAVCGAAIGIFMPEWSGEVWARIFRAAGKRPAPAQKPILSKSRRFIIVLLYSFCIMDW